MGIWTLVRYEQIDTLPAARLQEIFALAVTDEKPIWDHMQSKVIYIFNLYTYIYIYIHPDKKTILTSNDTC